MPDKYLLKTLKKLRLKEPLKKLETIAHWSDQSPRDHYTAQALKHARYEAETAISSTLKRKERYEQRATQRN